MVHQCLSTLKEKKEQKLQLLGRKKKEMNDYVEECMKRERKRDRKNDENIIV